MKKMFGCILFSLAFFNCVVANHTNISFVTAEKIAIVDVKEYGNYQYLQLADGTLWFLSTKVYDLFEKEDKDKPIFEIVKSYDPVFPYLLYSTQTGEAFPVIIIDVGRGISLETSIKTYKLTNIEKNGRGVIELDNGFFWSVDEAVKLTDIEKNERGVAKLDNGSFWSVDEVVVPSLIWEWAKGDSMVIAMKVRDTGVRYAKEGYVIINLDRDESIAVEKSFI